MEKMGVIYILTNPSFPEFVKIGYADDIEKRLQQLNRSECIPFAFRVYATYEVNSRLSDLKIHSIIDKLNPNLRSIDNFNGQKRVREFYAMSAEDAYSILEAIAEIHGCSEKLKLIQPNDIEKEAEETANEIVETQKERMSPFSFALCDIPVGSVVEFFYSASDKEGVPCIVVDEKHIESNGKIYSLTAFASEKMNGASVAGPRYFKYNGEWLNDIRHRLKV